MAFGRVRRCVFEVLSEEKHLGIGVQDRFKGCPGGILGDAPAAKGKEEVTGAADRGTAQPQVGTEPEAGEAFIVDYSQSAETV
jgi:hypothetical protein